MKVTKIDIIGHSGANKRPVSGDVMFSDGKFYGWSIVNGGVRFFTYRSTHAGTASSIVGFASPRRAAALLEML